MQYLTEDQLLQFKTDGYLCIPNYADLETITELRNSAADLVENLKIDELKIFTTENQSDILDSYFLDSADKVRCFFEEGAFDATGNLNRSKHLSINKIGHALHDRIEAFQKFSYNSSMRAIAMDLGIEKPQIVQSQYIFKQPQIGAQVHAHTDSTFIHTTPLSCLGAWLALEPSNQHNGCLSFIPKSHKKYSLQELYVLNEQKTGTEFINTEAERVSWPLDELEPVEVDPGTLVLLSGEVVHASGANHSNQSRHSYILHIVDGNCQWSSNNWLQRPEDFPFRNL